MAQMLGRWRPAHHQNKRDVFLKNAATGSRLTVRQHHNTNRTWWAVSRNAVKPFGIEQYNYVPRVLLDRHMYRRTWDEAIHLPDESRWEKMVNGRRVTEDRWALVEEDGETHKVNWKLYSQRISAEIKQSYEHLPSYRYEATNLPVIWRSLDAASAMMRRLSVREALAQCKLQNLKSFKVMHHVLEAAQQGAESKGLDKDRLRVTTLFTLKGPSDAAIDLKSRGFYSWKSKQSASLHVVVSEDPDMVLPDRTVVPFQVQAALRRAGIATKHTVLDVPAITAEGI